MNKVMIYRKSLGYTQKEWASILEISVDSYGRKERGKNSFKSEEMKKILDIVKHDYPSITIDDIFFGL